MSLREKVIKAGEWNILENPMCLVCCDCGLEHIYHFKRDKKGRILWNAFRENRSTGQFRRYRDYKCKPLKEETHVKE